MKPIFAVAIVAAALFVGGCATRMSDKLQSSYGTAAVTEEVTMEYRVYLPPGYESDAGRSYPLMVYFHGGGGSHRTWGKKGGLGEIALPYMEREEFGPFIVLSPTVGEMEIITGEAERTLMQDVIPRVQASYRTNGTTVAFGHSMGGLHALMLSLRHPEAFDAVAAASPFVFDVSPYQDAATQQEFERRYGGGFFLGRWQDGVEDVFGNQREFEAHSPFELIRRADSRRVNFPLFLTSGTRDQMGLFPQNERLHEELKQRGIAHEWVVQEGVGHSTVALPQMYDWLHRQATQKGLVSTGGGR